MSQFFKTVRFIWNHPLASKNRPLAFRQFLSWQLGQRMRPGPLQMSFVEDSILIVEKGMVGATGNIYTGLHEFEDMAFLLHILRAGDLFADVGANVGVYTILAAKNAGADVVSIEPVPSTFRRLQRNVAVNNVAGQVDLKCFGASHSSGTLLITASEDSVNHVVEKAEDGAGRQVIEVPVRSLDELMDGRRPALLKIDVEGFEWPALNGASRLLSDPGLKALIVELNGCGASYGFEDEEVHRLLLSFGFEPYSYDPFGRSLKKRNGYGHQNTIYGRDRDWLTRRVLEARKYRILNIEV